jgi:xanthine dehydrogenase accessory factor
VIFHKLALATEAGAAVDILTVIDSTLGSAYVGQMMIIYADGRVDTQLDQNIVGKILDVVQVGEWTKPKIISITDQLGEKCRIFWDKSVPKFRAIVFGGGHISQPLVQILSLVDFEVTVIDDRPEFANHARFPDAQSVICDNFHQVLKKLGIDSGTAVIIVTRGHRYDMECLRATMDSNCRYLGMIGSRRRIREILKVLREEGAPEDLEQRLRAPIGLDIKAQTPAEIAVSIAAEVVSAFRGGLGSPLHEHGEGV